MSNKKTLKEVFELSIFDSFTQNSNILVLHDTGKVSISNEEREYYKSLKGTTIKFEHKETKISGKIIEVDIPFNCTSFGVSSQKIGLKLEES